LRRCVYGRVVDFYVHGFWSIWGKEPRKSGLNYCDLERRAPPRSALRIRRRLHSGPGARRAASG
jgi:hypothetical protein